MIAVISILCMLLFGGPLNGQSLTADHISAAEFENIPDSVIESIKNNFEVFYGCTSHGGQVLNGMLVLEDSNSLYEFSYNTGVDALWVHQKSDDLGHNGDTSWVPITRSYLDNPDYNITVAMWSWCYGVSDNNEEGINIYLNAMSQLELEYPEVTFVYQTGHLDGSGPDGNLYIRNNQIRDYCENNNKVLYDFADIESYDLDGNYYPDGSDACEWCQTYCATNLCPDCYCAHSECLNCVLKGKAFWWLLAKLEGWENTSADKCGNVNGDSQINISDAVYIINYIFESGPAPDPLDAADANCDSRINIADVAFLINYAYGGGNIPCDLTGDGEPDC
jgi:hypothetical protein